MIHIMRHQQFYRVVANLDHADCRIADATIFQSRKTPNGTM